MEEKKTTKKTGEIKENFTYTYEDKFSFEDTQNRTLFLNTDVDEFIVNDIVYHILRYNRLDKGIPYEERKPIVVYINSPGGVVTDGYTLIDTILNSKTPVYTVNLGIAYSMGFLIYIAGHKRYSMPSATYLCHDGSSMAWDSMSKLKDRVEFETGQMEKHTQEYIISRTKITKEQYLENYRKEWYFYPDEAKKLGVVMYIIGEDCDIDEVI